MYSAHECPSLPLLVNGHIHLLLRVIVAVESSLAIVVILNEERAQSNTASLGILNDTCLSFWVIVETSS